MKLNTQISILLRARNVVIPCRNIKTEGGQRKGKLSVVKRKFVSDENGSYVAIEAKNSSSILKRMNYENKQLFGNLLDVVKNTYVSITKSKSSRKKVKPAEILGTDSTIPIQDVDLLHSKSPSCASNCEKTNHDLLCRDLSNIVDFPLINSKRLWKDASDSVIKLNLLRERVTSLCETKSFPSITRILENTMSPDKAAILERWKMNKIEEMGEEKFKQYQRDLLSNGASFHNTLNSYLSGTPDVHLVIQPANTGHWSSLKTFLPQVTEVKLIEEQVEHPFLGYRGVVDCFASYRNNFVVIDWKTSEKQKQSISSTFDAPLQVAAYVGALNFDSKFNYKVSKGLIAVAYNNGSPSSIFYLNESMILDYWKQWLKRLQLYWKRIEETKQEEKYL